MSVPIDRMFLAFGLRLAAVLFAAMTNVTIKLAEVAGVRLVELLVFRQVITAAMVLMLAGLGPGLGTLRTARIGAQLVRAAVGLTGMTCVFLALLTLPLAEATTIQFTVPIAATVLSAVVLKEAIGWHRWTAVTAGFAGIVIIVQPGSGNFPVMGAALGVFGAFMTATVMILLRRIGRTESAMTTVFWYSVLSLIPLLILYAFVGHQQSSWGWLLLCVSGILGGAGQIAMTAALRFAPVSALVPMDYSALIWAVTFSWLLFDTLPSHSMIIGAPIIIVSGLYIVWREHYLGRERTEQAVV